ncbi:MAG: alpha/beta fold hydrolase [Anaerolineae bacterium]|nr:MAG: alpha/beta fold hydrolase [Anaerolineae bacterium]
MKKRLTDFFLLVLILAALPLLVAVVVGLYFARLMVNPPRAKQWGTPGDEGWEYENVHFEASDSVPISSWFIPAPGGGHRPAVIIVHGWTWNRLGNNRSGILACVGSSPAELLTPARALNDAGYHVLMLDLRNHGCSGSSPAVTFGHDEANDLLGALRYLSGRDDVDANRVGVLGYSMGANAVMFACARTKAIKAAIVVQPVRPFAFANRLANGLLGPLGGVALNVARRMYYNAGGPLWETTDPAIVADLVSPTAIMYLQGDGDPWGDVPNVRRIYEMSKEPKALEIVPSTDRLGGYLYLNEHPEVILEFFEQYLTQ